MKTKKLSLLGLAAGVGGLAVLLWPWVARRLPLPGSLVGEPALVSVAEAQRQVTYPLWVPAQTPAGGTFLGAAVYRIKAPDLPEEIARAQAHSHYQTGYGLGFMELDGRVNVIGLPGSPAERAGLDRFRPLLAVAGRQSAARTLEAAATAVRQARPPVTLTYRAPGGAVRAVSIRPERYLTHPGVPHVYRGKLAVLDFRIRGRAIGLYERPVGEGEPVHGDHMRRAQIGGGDVLLADSDRGPVAFWTRGTTRFELDDTGGVLSQAEEMTFVQSMYLPHYQARR